MTRFAIGLIAVLALSSAASADPMTATEHAGRAVGHRVAQTGRATGHAVADAGREVGHATAVTGRHIAHGAERATHYRRHHHRRHHHG